MPQRVTTPAGAAECVCQGLHPRDVFIFTVLYVFIIEKLPSNIQF